MEEWNLTWTKLTSIDSVSVMSDGVAGVYRLSYFNEEDAKYYVFYVGQSEDIKKRVSEHLSYEEPNVCIKNYIATKKCFYRYATITSSKVRCAIERQAYRHYQPSCNEKEPAGSDNIKGNLN